MMRRSGVAAVVTAAVLAAACASATDARPATPAATGPTPLEDVQTAAPASPASPADAEADAERDAGSETSDAAAGTTASAALTSQEAGVPLNKPGHGRQTPQRDAGWRDGVYPERQPGAPWRRPGGGDFRRPVPPATLRTWMDFYLTQNGEAITDASMGIEYDMLAMVHGPFWGEAENIGGGHYLFTLDYIMFGPWDQTVTIRIGQQRIRLPVVLVAYP